MPRYFFHVRDSFFSPDMVGTELPDLRAARAKAVATAGSILCENSGGLCEGHPWRLELTGEGGQVLFAMQVVLDPPKLVE
ncbi:hypothetical protein EAH89_18255 [Roseomonas nepalensis]|uniref:DUF6894 domain-containing protein n=1 Tax=Muricoccus nepalensis TaxID=1854500 RepID=A0A502FU43_9PROT|nr:hypothetical protein EAH89_18255 [Roseomonas nepalensis]